MPRPAVACAVLLLLGACGGDDRNDTPNSVSVASGSTLRVRADEYSFDPARVVVKGAGPVTIALRNAGSLAHDLRLERGRREVGGTAVLPEGGSGRARVRLERGSYEFLCTVGDHAELGMTGELRVK